MARKKTAKKNQGPCPVVAIGASAGGIEALQTFFRAVPEDPGVAFLVVLHLSPNHESQLVQVLQRVTKLDVVQSQQGAELKPNCIYVIPPASMVRVFDDSISVQEPESEYERQHPVDAVFQSLAEERKASAICVVLSGSGTNGTAGAQHVRMADGAVIVQDPETAAHSEMPRSVIATGLADRVLAPQDMPRVVLSLARHAEAIRDTGEQRPAKADASELGDILTLLRTRGRHDFSPYKTTTIIRRILRRMGLNQIGSMADYARKLEDSPDEVQALVTDLLINVTSFFRDGEAWQAFEQEVVRPLVLERQTGEAIRAWTPACSTGEEAYSLAMVLLEHMEDADKRLDLKVFATDPSPQALAQARAGLFPDSIAETMPVDRLRRFFDKEDNHYRARKALRESVIFAPQNLLSDPPFSRLDIATCRNLLIYLEPAVQERVIALLHFAIREGGYLFLGTAENIGKHTDLFEPVSKKWRIYRRIGTTRHDLVDFPLMGASHRAQFEPRPPSHLRRSPAEEAKEALIDSYAPPSILIDDGQHVLYLHGEMSQSPELIAKKDRPLTSGGLNLKQS